MRLAKPRKKGLLRLLFSRLFLFVLLVVLQIALMVAVYGFFREYMRHFLIFESLFMMGMILYLFNIDMDSSAKLTWMAAIGAFPIPATIFLWYTRTNFGHRTLKARSAEMISLTKQSLPQDAKVLEDLAADNSGTEDLHRYINRSGCFPISAGNEVRYFPLGERMLEVILEELEKAKQFIYLEFFIIEEGEMWGAMLDILARKAAEGLDVRVMYDGMCEISNLPGNYPELLKSVGIRGKSFSPLTPFISTHYNYRDHRKILVIDGVTAFTGGVNLADEYINRKKRFGHWKDTGVVIRGEAAASFTLMFLQMWNVSEVKPDFGRIAALAGNRAVPADNGTAPADAGAAPEGTALPAEAGYVLPYADSPLDEEKVGESVYIDLLYKANRYVHIMTPYLILDGELETALLYAAERGIDVKLILPGIPDKHTAYALAKSHYRRLISGGVRLYEYTPGFVHAKMVVSDDRKGVIGTINLDYRSLYHHFECAAYLYGVPCISDMEKDFFETLSACREVTPESIRKERLFYKVLGAVLKLVAPLM